jgi:hypothetical protein
MLGDLSVKVADTVSHKLFSPIRSELAAVQRATEIAGRFLEAYRHNVASLVSLPPFDTHIRPAVVLLVGRIYGGATERLISLAAMVQLVFLGMRVHQQVGEDGAQPDDRNRLAVLIGDYCFCRFFVLGAHSGNTAFMRPFAEIVRRFTEGAVARLDAPPTPEVIRSAVRHETAALVAEACRMAGQVAGTSAREQERLYQLGQDLGMGYGLSMARGVESEAWTHLQAARARLSELPAGAARDVLDAVIGSLLDRLGQSVAEVQG